MTNKIVDIHWINLKCGVCGEQATVMVRDMIKYPSNRGIIEFKPCKDVHYFCKNHSRNSKTLDW